MPPQIKHIDCDCDEVDTPKKQHLDVFLEKSDCSIETDSTTSTEVDTSFSKDSLCTVDDYETDSQNDLRLRVFRSNDDEDDLNHEIWRLNDENNYELQKEQPIQRRKRRLLPIPPHYVLLLFSVLVAFKSIIATLDYQSTEYREWQRLQYETAPIILEEIKRQAPGKEFSILLKGSRLDFMQQALDNYSRCASVREIQMDMDGFEIPLDSLVLHHTAGKISPRRSFPTKGVLQLADDVVLSCDEIERGKN